MPAFFRLFKCHVKRFFSASAGILVFSIAFFAVLAFIAAVFTKNMSFSGTREKLKIGIVGDISIPYFDAGISTLKYLDSSNQFVEIITVDEDEAASLMNKGKLSAYIIIPDGFIEAVENGSNDRQVTYVTAAGAQGIESIFKEHIADIVSTLLVNAQAGIFAMENLAVENGQRHSLYDYNYEMNMKYIKWALDRKNFIRLQEVPLSNGVGIYGYYLCAVICSFIVFFSIGCLFLFTGKNNDRYKFFSSKGHSAFSQVLAEYSTYLLLLLFCLSVVFILILIFVLSGKLSLSEWRFTGNASGIINLFFTTIPVCLMFTAMQIMLFEAVNQTVAAILLQFITGFFISFTGGCFYPLDFFPDFIRSAGSILPAGQALLLLDSSLAGKLNNTSLFICLAYAIVFFIATVLLRCLHIKGEDAE